MRWYHQIRNELHASINRVFPFIEGVKFLTLVNEKPCLGSGGLIFKIVKDLQLLCQHFLKVTVVYVSQNNFNFALFLACSGNSCVNSTLKLQHHRVKTSKQLTFHAAGTSRIRAIRSVSPTLFIFAFSKV